jgi:small subunit ribosomal protein S16
MIKIRLSRLGKKNDAFYRVVAIESTKKRGGEPLAILGFWHPKEKTINVDKKAIDGYVKNGAQVSPAVKKLLS